MKLHNIQDLIYFNTNPKIGNKTDKKQDSLKSKTKNYPGEINSKMVSLYIPIFKTGLTKVLIKLLIHLKKITKGQKLNTDAQCYAMTRNLLAEEALQVFKQKLRGTGN